MSHDLILCLKRVLVNDLDPSCLGVPEETLIILKEISGKDSDLGYKTLSLNGDG